MKCFGINCKGRAFSVYIDPRYIIFLLKWSYTVLLCYDQNWFVTFAGLQSEGTCVLLICVEFIHETSQNEILSYRDNAIRIKRQLRGLSQTFVYCLQNHPSNYRIFIQIDLLLTWCLMSPSVYLRLNKVDIYYETVVIAKQGIKQGGLAKFDILFPSPNYAW